MPSAFGHQVAVAVERARHIADRLIPERDDAEAGIRDVAKRGRKVRIETGRQSAAAACAAPRSTTRSASSTTLGQCDAPGSSIALLDATTRRCTRRAPSEPRGERRQSTSPMPPSKAHQSARPAPRLRRANIARTRLPCSRSISTIVGNCARTDSSAAVTGRNPGHGSVDQRLGRFGADAPPRKFDRPSHPRPPAARRRTARHQPQLRAPAERIASRAATGASRAPGTAGRRGR